MIPFGDASDEAMKVMVVQREALRLMTSGLITKVPCQVSEHCMHGIWRSDVAAGTEARDCNGREWGVCTKIERALIELHARRALRCMHRRLTVHFETGSGRRTEGGGQ